MQDIYLPGNICRDKFWDFTLTWNSSTPDFPQCFQQTIFISAPCLVFCLVGIINLWNNARRNINVAFPWTVLGILKIAVCIILTIVSILEISFVAYQKSVDSTTPDIVIYASSIKILTYVLILLILKQNKRVGIRSSASLSIFWFVFTICSAICYRSSLFKMYDQVYAPSSIDLCVLDMVHFPLVLSQFIFTLFNDPEYNSYKDASFIEGSPLFSILTFSWFNRYMYKSTKKQLALDDFQPLPRKLRAAYLWEKFEAVWKKAVQKLNTTESKEEKSSLILGWVLTRTFWIYCTYGILFQIAYDLLIFIPPLLLDKIMTFVTVGDDFAWKGYVLCVALCFSDFIAHVAFTFMMFFSAFFASQVKSASISAIFRKAIKLSSSARRQYTSGEMVNLMSVDVENLYMMALFSNLLLGAPLKLILTLVFLWQYLGASCLAGVGVLILMLVFGSYIAKKSQIVQEKQMETKDTRLKFMNEILNGIKVLKLYAWELPFTDRLSKIRQIEVNFIRKFQLIFSGSVFIWNCGPLFVAIASIVTYILVDDKHVLDATTIFVSINLLNILRNAVLEIPEVTAKFVQTVVSLKRLHKFLTAEEYEEKAVGNSCDLNEVISVKNGTFAWSTDGEPNLKNIDFHVPKGSLIAVIGPVGAGKSSLISAILGEMYMRSGSVNVKGRLSYVPQQAWILNRTLRDNVLFVNPMNKSKYDAVLDNCCLRPDLEILPGDDKTEIGEKGVNLSGGQKQRVSLARAVFNDSDIYLFDDPLSAVDSHVGKHIFENVIGRIGLLRNKTRILVTHNVSFLSETDFIVTMKDGKIHEAGSYNELMECGGVFSEFIEEHMNVKETEDAEEELKANAVRSISCDGPLLRNLSVDSTTSVASGRLVDDEGMEIGKVKRKIYINYMKHMGLLLFSGMVLGSLFSQAFEIGSGVWLSKWSSDPFQPNRTQDVQQRNHRIIIYTVLGLAKGVTDIIGVICLAFGSARSSKLYHREMLYSIMRAPMSFFDTTPLGRIVNRFGRDIDDVDVEIPMSIFSVLSCVFYAIATFILISVNTPLFLAFLLPIGLIYYVIQHFYLITSRQLKRLASITRSPVYSHFTETVSGAVSIRAYNVSHHFLETADKKIDTNIMCYLYQYMANRWLEIYISLIGDCILLIATILAVESRDFLSAGVVGLTVTYALTITEVLTWIVYSGTEMETKSVSVERIEEYSNLPPEAPWNISDSSLPPTWPSNGRLEFKGYSTRYRDELDLVLKNMNLYIKENEKVGIVGRTGAGKSSFALALFRIIEAAEGAVLIDDIDISKIGLHQLRSKLTIIPQEPVLFTGPLRMNLDPNSEHSDTELWSSLGSAHLKNFVSTLPDGLNHEIAEGGDNLSVGQRQLVCLARALLKQAKILILDEATAAVDMDTDSLIQNTIRSEFKHYTVITIAHRLNTIMDYDKVVVMSAGEIIEIGKPSELLQNPNSHFYDMAKDAGLV